MRLIFSLVLLLVLQSCGNNDVTLDSDDLNKIEDKILAAIKTGKLKVYSDLSLDNQDDANNFLNLVPTDSTGRLDIANLSFITEEILAVEQNEFENNSTKIGALLLTTEIPVSNGFQTIEAGFVKMNELKKIITKDEQLGLQQLSNEFHRQNQIIYNQEVELLKLRKITEKLFEASKSGDIAAYENENLSSIFNPQELDRLGAREEVLSIPDVKNEGMLKDTIVIDPIVVDDIIDYKPHFNEKNKLVSYSLIYLFKEAGHQIRVPWIVLSHEEVKKVLDLDKYNFLEEYLNRFAKETKDENTDDEV